MDTNQFRLDLMALMATEDLMVCVDANRHNTEVTVAGVTYARVIEMINGYSVEYARVIEMINGYSVEFAPDSQWTVILEGSNNNIFDVENGILQQNQVQVISTNSAGLIVAPGGGGILGINGLGT
jgi:hypothetical protein